MVKCWLCDKAYRENECYIYTTNYTYEMNYPKKEMITCKVCECNMSVVVCKKCRSYGGPNNDWDSFWGRWVELLDMPCESCRRDKKIEEVLGE